MNVFTRSTYLADLVDQVQPIGFYLELSSIPITFLSKKSKDPRTAKSVKMFERGAKTDGLPNRSEFLKRDTWIYGLPNLTDLAVRGSLHGFLIQKSNRY